MKKKQSQTWITEKEAAQIIELPGKFFRKLVTEGPLKGVVNYFKSKRAAYRYNKIELEKQLKFYEWEYERSRNLLTNNNFRKKAPAQLVAEEEKKLIYYEEQKKKLQTELKKFI